jgi:hypothetical protein
VVRVGLDGRRGGERKLKVIRVRGDETMDEVDLLERVMDILDRNLSAPNGESSDQDGMVTS